MVTTILRRMCQARAAHRPLGSGARGVVALLFACIALAGCGPKDPLEPILEQVSRGEYREAIEPLRQLIAERKGDARIQYLYGFTLTQLGHRTLAEWSLREAMNDPEWLVRAGLLLAHGALVTRNYPLAVEAADRVLAAEPERVEALLMRANAHAHSRVEPEAALADVERILAIDPDNLDALEPKIIALLTQENAEEAGKAIDELGHRIEEAELGSDLPGWHCATAALFAEESGEDELADKRFADCTERFPGHQNVISNAMAFYDGRGDHARALEILRRGQQENPESRDLRFLLADRLRQTGATSEAEALLREATETSEPLLASVAWLDLAKHFQEVRDYTAAARAAETAYGLVRDTGEMLPDVLLEYADALVLAGEPERALEVVEEMTLPAHQELIRASVAQEAGRHAEALEHYDRMFVLWPDNPFARYEAALAAEAIGDFDRAIDEYRYSIRIHAGATDARTRIGRLHTAEGRFQDALTLLRLKVDQAPLDLEGELLSMYLLARVGRNVEVNNGIIAFLRARPEHLGAAVARAAQGVADRPGPRGGPETAIRVVRESEAVGLDLTDPRQADALRELVKLQHQVGRLGDVDAAVQAASKAVPEAAVFHEIQGLHHELAGRSEDARKAYARALGIDPAQVRALVGLGRLDRGDPARALVHFDRALEEQPSDPDALRGAAEALVAAGRTDEAGARLRILLEHHPYDAAGARMLAELELARAAPDQALVLAKRAVRFLGGPDALDVLGRVYEELGETEQATRAAERARELRDRLGG
jgi:tetratricopeptide (TPR) repeat protein